MVKSTRNKEEMVSRTLPNTVIDKDLRLRTRIEKDSVSLGRLRYEWCCKRGWGYTEYARSVGLTINTIGRSVKEYAAANGLPIATKASQSREDQRVGKASGGHLRSATPKLPPTYAHLMVSFALHARIKAAAATEGLSMMDFVTEILTVGIESLGYRRAA